jgi:uncharacterized membrane protein YraQ (UPF0718 family)
MGIRVLEGAVRLFLEVLPFFAVGVTIGGALKAHGDRLGFARRLGGSPAAIVLGALLGCVLPVCSCGVVPVGAGLLAGGVAPGPVFAFLAAGPMVNPASFVMTAGVVGLDLAVGRLVGAVFVGACVGFAARLASRRGNLVRPVGTCSCAEKAREVHEFRPMRALFLAGELFASLLTYVAAGVLLGALVGAALDPRTVARFLSGARGVPLAAAAGVPLYLCSCAEVPVAVALVRTGLDPAAVLTFLLAGPGVSVFSVAVLGRIVRVRGLLLYAATFVASSMAVGFTWKGLFG